MTVTRRLLVTGGNGLLGTKLLELLTPRADLAVHSSSRGACSNASAGRFDYYELDVTQPAQIQRVLDAVQPEVVIHTAAMTDVDGCERQPERCWSANAAATESLARACGRREVRLVHLSTEYVFDGRSGPYSEDDPVRPISQYGKSKLAGETAVREQCRSWAVARTTVVYGQAVGRRKNFVVWLLEELAAGRSVRIVSDQVGSPTYADNLAQMVAAIALSRETGIFHTVGASVIDRFAFSRLAADVFGLPADLIRPIATSELNQPAPRPLQGGLKVDKFCRTFPWVPVLSAREGLEALKEQMSRRDA
jgi:dTDP-4-dehydrorhamnose reductase